MAILNIPSDFTTNVQQIMDELITNLGNTCTIYYPPTPSGCSNCAVDVIGNKSANIWIDGGPYPFYAGQICPLCNGSYFIAIENTDSIKMTVRWNPDKYDPSFLAGYRHSEGVIMTRGYTSDLQKVLNCNYIQVNRGKGFDHYNFKLVGEPVFPDQFVDSRYFYAYWDRI